MTGQGLSVHEDHALLEPGQLHKRVLRLFARVERAAQEYGRTVERRHAVLEFQRGKIVHRQRPFVPAVQELLSQPDALGHALGVAQVGTVVDAPHVFHQHVQRQSLRGHAQAHGALRVVAVDDSLEFAVREHVRAVAHVLKNQFVFFARALHVRVIQDEAAALPQLFHRRGRGGVVLFAQRVQRVEQLRALRQLHRAIAGLGQVRGLGLVRNGRVLRDDLAEQPVLGRDVAALVQKRVVVIAVDRGLIVAHGGAVRAVHEAEVRAAVERVRRGGRAQRQELIELLRGFGGHAGVMLLAPVVEPAVPVFGAHQGAVGLEAAQARHLLLGAGAEVARLVHIIKRSAGQHEVGGAVGGKQRHGDAARAHAVSDIGKVLVVVAVAAVFVFHLHHQDVAALGNLVRLQKRHQAVIENVHLRKVPRVGAAQRHVFF